MDDFNNAMTADFRPRCLLKTLTDRISFPTPLLVSAVGPQTNQVGPKYLWNGITFWFYNIIKYFKNDSLISRTQTYELHGHILMHNELHEHSLVTIELHGHSLMHNELY